MTKPLSVATLDIDVSEIDDIIDWRRCFLGVEDPDWLASEVLRFVVVRVTADVLCRVLVVLEVNEARREPSGVVNMRPAIELDDAAMVDVVTLSSIRSSIWLLCNFETFVFSCLT